MNTNRNPKSNKAGKLRRGRPLKPRQFVLDSLGGISPNVALEVAATQVYLRHGTYRAVAEKLQISTTAAFNYVQAAFAHLRGASDPAQKTAVLGLIESRLNSLWATTDAAISHCVASGQVEKIASLVASASRVCEQLAKIHGVGSSSEILPENNSARLEETARRLALIGIHSRAREMAPAVRAALSTATSKPPADETSMPEAVRNPVSPSQSVAEGDEHPLPAPPVSGCWADCPP